MNLILRFLTILSLGCCGVSGFSFAQTVEHIESNGVPTPEKNSVNTVGQYLIGSGDVLDIRIYNRPQLSRETVRVDGQGMIRMPLIKEPIRASCRGQSNRS